MITTEIKLKIVEAVKERRRNYASDVKMSVALGISGSQFSRIKNGDIDGVLSDANWISIARKLDVQFGNNVELVTAATPVYLFITGQLNACQQFSLSGILCDIADIGKTYAAKCYVKEHRNAWYIDCSQNKTKQKLVRAIAKEAGLNHTGRYAEVYEDLMFYLRSVPTPLIILDEAGDLDYPAFLELKAMWNATERACGWYMMGADGLKAKIERNLAHRKVGYTEILSRMGNRFQKVTPDGTDKEDFIKQQVALIGKANGVADVQKLYAKTGGSLRRIYIEIQKLKQEAA